MAFLTKLINQYKKVLLIGIKMTTKTKYLNYWMGIFRFSQMAYSGCLSSANDVNIILIN